MHRCSKPERQIYQACGGSRQEGLPGVSRANAVITAFVEAIDKTKVERRLGINTNSEDLDGDDDSGNDLHDEEETADGGIEDKPEVSFTEDRQAFNDGNTVTTWANGESACSREQRQHDIPSAIGKKADCRVTAEIGELLFVELKRDKHTETSLYKLGRFEIPAHVAPLPQARRPDTSNMWWKPWRRPAERFSKKSGRLCGKSKTSARFCMWSAGSGGEAMICPPCTSLAAENGALMLRLRAWCEVPANTRRSRIPTTLAKCAVGQPI
ncbi:hypothetical protein HDU88_003682 [Geranomyces variabilis]|nr:hypothetical protein HDU88_003682 [Geranomyces variabilis]